MNKSEKSYTATVRNYFSTKKNFDLFEMLFLVLLIIPPLLIFEVMSGGIYPHTEDAFGGSHWIQFFYLFFLSGIYFFFSSLFFIIYYPDKKFAKDGFNIFYFIGAFSFFILFPIVFTSWWPDVFYKMEYHYKSTRDLYEDVNTLVQIPRKPYDKNLPASYYRSEEYQNQSVGASYYFSLKDKELIHKFPGLTIYDQYRNFQTAIVCGFRSVGIAQREVYGLQTIYNTTPDSKYFFIEHFNYIVDYTRKYFEEVFLAYAKGIGWVMNIFIFHYIFFFFKQKTAFFYEILSKT